MSAATLPAILGGEPVRASGPPEWPPHDPNVIEALARCAADGSWGKYWGPHVPALAARLAEYHDGAEVYLCSSGTAAIELALRGLRVGPGDEVILSAFDFKGNFLDVLAVGAQPVLVDLEPQSCAIDVRAVEAALTPQTRAIIVSHLYGSVIEMRGLMQLASQRGVGVIEDACQCPGAIIGDRRAGLWGDVGVLSFGGSKLLSAGRGGAVLTRRADVSQRIRLYEFRGNHAYPLSELQACALLPQLAKLDRRNVQRLQSVAELAALPLHGLRLFQNRQTDGEPGYYKTAFEYQPAAFSGMSRERFVEAIRAEGIPFDVGFRALHSIHGKSRYRAAGDLGRAELAERSLIVLHHPILLEPEGSRQIAAAVAKIAEHAAAIAAGGTAVRISGSHASD